MYNPDNWPEQVDRVKKVVTETNGSLSVTGTEGWTFGISAEEYLEAGYLPEPGDRLVLLGGLGRPITGIFINDICFRYVTRDEQESQHKIWIQDLNRKRKEQFYTNISSWIERKNKLPEPFQERMNRFSRNNFEEFWTNDGGYELFILEEATKIARLISSEKEIDALYKKDYNEVAGLGLSSDHSGNTWGGAFALAKALKRGDPV